MARDYGRIHTNFWNSADIRPLSDAGKLLAAYLLTSPHSNIIGAYLAPDSYIADDMAWPVETVTRTLQELIAKGFCQRFGDKRHIVVRRYLAWNGIENGNVLKAAFKQADALPDDPALFHVVKGLEPYAKHFGDTSERVWQTLRERLPEPFRNMDMEPKPNPEMEQTPAPKQLASSSKPNLPKSTKPPRTGPEPTASSDFQAFYDLYPKKKNRKQAEVAFPRALKRASLAKILAGVERYAAERHGQDERYTKHAATWLNNDCWNDYDKATNGAGDDDEDARLARIFGAIAIDVGIYRKTGAWVEFRNGRKPDDPMTQIDPVILSRWGYADAAIYERWKDAHPA